jgi:Right handed beta helix region
MTQRGPGPGIRAVIAAGLLVAAPVALLATPASGGSGHQPSGRRCVDLAEEIGRANDVRHDVRIELDPACPPQRDLVLTVAANGGRTVTIEGHGATLGGGSDSLFRVDSGAHLTVRQVTFSGSHAGVVENVGGDVVIEASTFSDNHGGAVENASTDRLGRVTISDTTFEGNRADEGGAILSDDGDLAITRSTFARNVALDGDGGAILVDDGTLSVVNSTFSGNVAARGGGALASVDSGVTLTNVTVWGNEADSSGGLTGPVTAANTLVAGNSPGNCGAAALVEGRPAGGRPNNLSDGRDCGSSFVVAPSAGVDPGLADNGGTTATHALLPGSAAVDAGSNGLCPSADQRGIRRERSEVDACDIGAFEGTSEESPPPPPPPAPSPLPVNQRPIAADGIESMTAGTAPLALDLARLATDAETSDGDLRYALVGPKPREGAASLVGSVVVYTTGPDAAGTERIHYRVTDGGNPDGCAGSRAACAPARSASGVVVITITAATSPSPSASGVGPDLALEDVRLELVAGNSAEGRRVTSFAAGPGWRARIAAALEAAAGDSLRLRGRVVNNGDEASAPTTLEVATSDWEADPIPVAAVEPSDSLDIDESIPPPPDVADDTKFTVSLVAAEGEANASDNVKTNVVALLPRGGSTTKTIVLVLVTVVVAAGAAVGASALTHMLRKPPTNTPSQSQQPAGGAVLPFDGLQQLADLYLGAEAGPALWSLGKKSMALKDSLGQEEAASRVIGTLFWRALMASRQFDDVLREAGASDAARLRPDVVVVPHAGGTRFDLVVLDPLFAGGEPSGMPLEPDVDDLVEGWRRIVSSAGSGERGSRSMHLSLTDVLPEIARATTFHVAVAASPELVLTNAISPPWPVGEEDEEATSTSGVVAIDALGRTGVTVADHAVRGRQQVMVNGHLGTVVSSDPISDSGFVEVEIEEVTAARGARGPLSGVSPRQMEVAEFDGIRSGRTSTRVTGWDPTILTTESFIQTKIVTEPVTLPGDSGAALVDGDGHVLGFAFYTTGLNAQPAHSGWIWAESVYRAHGLRPLTDAGD